MNRRSFLSLIAAVVAVPKALFAKKARGPRWRMGVYVPGGEINGPWIDGEPPMMWEAPPDKCAFCLGTRFARKRTCPRHGQDSYAEPIGWLNSRKGK